MPNWAFNTLTVYGKQDELHEFTKSITNEEGNISLVTLKPMPDILKNTEAPWADSPEPHPNWAVLLKDGEISQDWHDELCEKRRENHEAGVQAFKETGYHDWYEWSVANWGTKWPPSDTWVNQMVDCVEIKFSSAWSPPVKLIETIAEKNPHLSFVLYFTEEADQYTGAILYADGQPQLEVSYDFDDDLRFPESFKDRYLRAVADGDSDAMHEVYLDLLTKCISDVERQLFNNK